MTARAQSDSKLTWELERPEDGKRWWVRESLYTIQPRTPLSDSFYTREWDEAVLCIGEELSFPNSRGFNARTVNGYTYLSPMPITDPDLIQKRLPKFLNRIAELQANADQDFARYHAEQEREMEYWKAADLGNPNLMILLEYWRRVLLTSDRFWKLHFLIVFPRHVVAGMFEHAAHDAGVQASADIGKLTQSHGMTRQMQLDMELWRLAGRAIELGLKDTFLNTFEEDLQKTLESSGQGPVWLDELNRFLDVYGARTVIPMELHDRSWQEDPTPVLGTIRSYVAQGGRYNFDRLIRDMAEERQRLSQALLDRINDPEAREKFRNLLESARKFQQAMEDDNYYFLRGAIVQVRWVAVEIGKRLAAGGALDDPDDVFFLRKEEMERALVDLASGLYDMSPYRKLAPDRRAQWNEWCRVQPPPYLGDLPEELDDFMLTQFWGIRGRKQLDESEGAVAGLGASGGVAEGVARLVFGPEEFGKIQPGEVLVCRSSNPAWTPLFSKIRAIVTDQGGTLSHAAVVAREYGIPAVLGTQHATRRIPDGARVRVDGNTGKVELL